MGPVAPQHVGSSQTRARTRVPCIGRWILNHCATREAPNGPGFANLQLWSTAHPSLSSLWVLPSPAHKVSPSLSSILPSPPPLPVPPALESGVDPSLKLFCITPPPPARLDHPPSIYAHILTHIYLSIHSAASKIRFCYSC